jgi:uncharacterized membrane protein
MGEALRKSEQSLRTVESDIARPSDRPEQEAPSHGVVKMPEKRRDGLATTIGLVTFLAGVGLIVLTFLLAQTMFSVAPEDALGIRAGQTLDLNGVLKSGMTILMKIILLVVMAGIGSAVATRGIKLYTGTKRD